MIEIKYASNSVADKFELSINDKDTQIITATGQLLSDADLPIGINVLKLRLLSDSQVSVNEVNVGGVGLREWLYLSWSQDSQGNKFQCTNLSQGQEIYIPFANPMSLWIDLVISKISCHDMRQDIHQTHNLYFGGRKSLDNKFPALVKEFFANEFNFVVVDKLSTDLRVIPFLKLNITRESVANLANSSKQLFESGAVSYAVKSSLNEDKYLLRDDPDWIPRSRSRMKIINFQSRPEVLINQTVLPDFYQLVNQLGINDIYSAQINFIEAGGYTPPHRDYEVRDDGYPLEADGCCQVYIPLLSEETGNFLKIAGVGIFNVGQQSLVINNNYYTHAVVNSSDQLRSVLIIRCNFNSNRHLIQL